MANTSWSGLTPENDKVWEELFEKYVPSTGTANTVGGEILRAMARIIYRFYNDGDMVGVGYGNETVNSSNRYLCDTVPGYKSLDGFAEWAEDDYEARMLDNHVTVFEYLQGDGKETFGMENTFDSREMSQEDRDREREWEREYENEDSDWED